MDRKEGQQPLEDMKQFLLTVDWKGKGKDMRSGNIEQSQFSEDRDPLYTRQVYAIREF